VRGRADKKHILIRSVSNTGKKYESFLSAKKDTGEKQI
jgi:hypothetical protein